jgi:hypothetical protein
LHDEPDAWVREPADNITATIRRAIVHNDQLEVLVRLRQH